MPRKAKENEDDNEVAEEFETMAAEEEGEGFTGEDNAANDEPDDAEEQAEVADEQRYFSPSFEPPEIPEIKKAAAAYVAAKNKRVKATEKETSTNAVLAEAMRENQDNLPRRKLKSGIIIVTYPLGDGTEAAIVPSKIKAKVQPIPEPDND